MYKDFEKRKNEYFIKSGFFNGDKGNGVFKGKKYPYVLEKYENNFYTPITKKVIEYFDKNNINWQNTDSSINDPSDNTLESQIACLNHLFYFRRNKFLTLHILNYITNKKFIDLLPLKNDEYDLAYISFEVASKSDHLNERTKSRRKFNTSINALFLSKDKMHKIYLVMIEWKYTEENISNDFSDDERSSKEILRRYSNLINNSKQLKYDDYKSSIYFQYEFYQLIRQTLLAEQMIENKNAETIKTDDFLHIIVFPNANNDMLSKESAV